MKFYYKTMQEDLINPQFQKHGYIQVYTGNGKGKTTASLGLCMRALGRGWNVLVALFAKGGNDYGELFSFKQLMPTLNNKLEIIQAGLDRIVYAENITEQDKQAIQQGWQKVKNEAQSGIYDLIILDEANIALDLNLIDIEDMLDFLKNKPESLEVVLTGRNANKKIIEVAHLVSEIIPIKHYWDIGVKARKGIEF